MLSHLGNHTWHVVARSECAPEKQDADLRFALRFSHYTEEIYDVMSGEGVALAWQRFLYRQISEGQLVRLGSAYMDPEDGYHAVIADGVDLDEDAQQIIDWIAGEFALSAQSA